MQLNRAPSIVSLALVYYLHHNCHILRIREWLFINRKDENVYVAFKEELQKAIFVKRPNRFIIECRLKEGGPIIEAHLPDPGRLKELLIPGKAVWLRPALDNPQRRTKWSAALVESPNKKELISLDSTLPNRLIAKALKEKAIPPLALWNFEKAEYLMGGSRFDFLLVNNDKKMVLEVKSVTLVKGKTGFFPDAVTARGSRHLKELSKINKLRNWKAAVLFVLQRSDAVKIVAAPEIDPEFAKSLQEARECGVTILGVNCSIFTDRVVLGNLIPVE